MAKNWTAAEAVKVISEGTDLASIQDIGGRFPLFAVMSARLNEAGVEFASAIPELITARKIEAALKDGVEAVEEEEVVEETTTKKTASKKAPAKKAAPEPEEDEEEDEEEDLMSKTAKELYAMCKEAGLSPKPKQNKSVYIKALESVQQEEEDDEDWGDEEEETPAKKTTKRGSKKAKPADDDDDWGI